MGELKMRLTSGRLKSLILEVLEEEQFNEAKMSDFCFSATSKMAPKSTHDLQTCRMGDDQYFLKFSDSWEFANPSHKSLQIGVEYLAYKIYELYPSNIPEKIHVVSDPKEKRIGLATSAVSGETGRNLRYDFPAEKWVKSISGGAMVDVFLANWDVSNTSNFIVDKDTAKATRVDPGGSLTFRARGSKKIDRDTGGPGFKPDAPELDSMMNPNRQGAGWLLSQVDMKQACEAFLSVDWSAIGGAISEAFNDVAEELRNAGLEDQLPDWQEEIVEITQTLRSRHDVVRQHCEHALQTM
jgi:hypothetical protein